MQRRQQQQQQRRHTFKGNRRKCSWCVASALQLAQQGLPSVQAASRRRGAPGGLEGVVPVCWYVRCSPLLSAVVFLRCCADAAPSNMRHVLPDAAVVVWRPCADVACS
jgi:hypothetical protein